jgi:hypothetical protein
LDFSWTPEQTRLRDSVVELARRELNAGLSARDRDSQFNLEGWRKCGAIGLQGLPVPEKYGGSGTDVLTTVYVLEGLGYGCLDNGLIFSLHAHMWSCVLPVLTFGNESQKQAYLPKLCNGAFIGGNATSEPESGSDAYAMSATATKKGDRYVLNGSKLFITNGPVADVLIVFATLDKSQGAKGVTAFLVNKGTPGMTVTRKIEKMGIRTSPMAELFFDNCEVPAENRLGREGAGLAIFSHAMEWERGFILSSAVGAMERILESCVRYAKRRRQFGQPVAKFQLVSTKLVDMKLRLETARQLLYKVAWLKHSGKPIYMEAAMAKLYISEAWVQTTLDAVQVHGGYGYLTEMEVEREVRDALGSRLYSGTSEIQRQIIAQFMGL